MNATQEQFAEWQARRPIVMKKLTEQQLLTIERAQEEFSAETDQRYQKIVENLAHILNIPPEYIHAVWNG